MPGYNAYGLRIDSEFPLPELPTVEGENFEADVVFRRGEVDLVPESVGGTGGRRIVAEPGRCQLSYDSYGTFLVEDGESVTFDPESEEVLVMKVLRRLLENEMLGILLHQRGRLVLHASAVSLGGKAAVFLGSRGVGKSTTAAVLHANGHRMLEDDLVSIRFDGEKPIVDPGVPEARLTSETVEGLRVDGTEAYQNDGGSNKLYKQIERISDAAPVGAFYRLETGDEISCRLMRQRRQLFSLFESTYVQGLLSETGQTGRHFQQCSSLVETVPFYRLTRPDDFDRVSKFVETIEKDEIIG